MLQIQCVANIRNDLKVTLKPSIKDSNVVNLSTNKPCDTSRTMIKIQLL